jgi:hypothetical protein
VPHPSKKNASVDDAAGLSGAASRPSGERSPSQGVY